MAAASEYVSKETLEQVSTESFAQNLSNFRSLLLQWEKEVDSGGAGEVRARIIFREVAMLQEIVQKQMTAKGRELGVPPEAVQEVEAIYRRAVNKVALRIAADSKIMNPEMDRFLEVIKGLPSPPPQMKELATKIDLARVAYQTIITAPHAASLVAPTFLKILEEIVALYKQLGGSIPVIQPEVTAGPPAPPMPPTASPGGGGDDLPRRVDRLETKVENMAQDIASIKTTLVRMEELLRHSAAKSDIARIDERLTHIPTNAQMYLAGGAALAAILGVMAKGFGWL